MRTLLLLATISVGLLLHQTHRAHRTEPPSPAATGGAAERPAAPASGTGEAPHPEPPPAARALEAEEEPETPLSAMDREVLREAREEWLHPPPGLIERSLPYEEAREVAIVTLRGALRESAERHPRAPEGAGRRVRAHLRGRGTIDLDDPRYRADRIAGETADGRAVEIPAAAVLSIEEIPAEAAAAAPSDGIEDRIAALSSGGADERTVALELVLRLGDLPRAEEMFAAWLGTGGPAALAASATDPERRARLDLAVRKLAAPPPSSADSRARPRASGVRDLAALTEFLATASPSRDLSSAERVALAEECSAWSNWLAEKGDLLRLAAPERHSLEQSLRLLRYDLLKGTGF